jgi:hypothetical protein
MVLRKLPLSFMAFILFFFVAIVPAVAQTDLAKSYTFDGGATFNYPADWRLSDANERVQVFSDATRVYVLDEAALSGIGVKTTANEADALQLYFETYHSDRAFKPAKVETLEINGRSTAQYDYSADDGRARIIAFRFTNGALGLIEAMSLAGKLKEEELALAIAASFDSSSEATTTASTEAIDCTVSTRVADTVRVRVGPGENRASIIFLPSDEDFQVLGQASANDGSLWWKLDKEAVAPQKSANEVWVAQNDVRATGNCGAVVDVNAPPIIPISNVPPPSGNSGGGNSGVPPASGSGLPTTGLYSGSIGDGNASCADIPNVNFQPDNRQFTAFIQPSGSSFIYVDGGGPLVRSSGNTFSGTITYVDPADNRAFSRTMTLTVVSSTQIVGTFTDTIEYDGRLCSATLPITMNLQ